MEEEIKRTAALYLVGMIFLVGCWSSTPLYAETATGVQPSHSQSPTGGNVGVETTPTETNTPTPLPLDVPSIVANGGFEEGADEPSSWRKEAWVAERSLFRWEKDNPVCGSKCISITNFEENDARWIQSVRVTPGEVYVLSGRIKGEAIQGNSIGANLFATDSDFHHTESENSTGTFDWKTVTMTFIAPQSGVVDIGCRLGFFGSTVTGTAYFDDISVEVDSTYRVVEGRNIVLNLERSDTEPSTIRPETLAGWVEKLDRAYDEYSVLVGAKPAGGEKIWILSTRSYPGGWAVAGNPILWYQPYIRNELSLVEREGDWSFGILHEIGHDFDIEDRWNYDAEFFANFKMYYVVISLQAKVSPSHDRYYTGSELKDFYRLAIVPGKPSMDAITYRWIVMTEEIGWDPFMNTFRFFLALPRSDIPATRLEKYHLFMDKLSDFSGRDAYEWIPPEENALLEAYLAE
jgi:hypothetical protein